MVTEKLEFLRPQQIAAKPMRQGAQWSVSMMAPATNVPKWILARLIPKSLRLNGDGISEL